MIVFTKFEEERVLLRDIADFLLKVLENQKRSYRSAGGLPPLLEKLNREIQDFEDELISRQAEEEITSRMQDSYNKRDMSKALGWVFWSWVINMYTNQFLTPRGEDIDKELLKEKLEIRTEITVSLIREYIANSKQKRDWNTLIGGCRILPLVGPIRSSGKDSASCKRRAR